MSFQKNVRAVRRYARLMQFGNWLQKLPNKLTPSPFRLMQIGSAFWQSRALAAAASLNLATQLGDRQLTAEALAAELQIPADGLHRLLRLLAALGIFEEVAPHTFANNRLSAPLRDGSPDSVRAMILMHNAPEMSRPWYEQLENGIRDGSVPFQQTHGQPLFDYMDAHPEFNALFSRAMESMEALSGSSFAEDFDWRRFGRLLDIGGSRGSKAVAILKQHPDLQALVVDRAAVIETAQQFWRDQLEPELLNRLHFQPGNLLETLPPARNNRDVYLLSAVLHGFDDAMAILALQNLVKAIGNTGARIALLEQVLPETKASLPAATFDLQMFMGTRGRERTLDEWQQVFDQAGVQLEAVIGLQSFASILLLQVNTRPLP